MRQLVHEAVEASRLAADAANAAAARETDKRKARTMSSNERILKNISTMGEAAYAAAVQKYADSVKRPGETSAMAFSRIFCGTDAESIAIRKFWQVAKQGGGDGALSASEYDDADAELQDDAEDDRDSALRLLEQLADKLRSRNPSLSKAAAFTAIYCDPQYAPLAKRERAASMRRIGATV
jgi:hypothetical protein